MSSVRLGVTLLAYNAVSGEEYRILQIIHMVA